VSHLIVFRDHKLSASPKLGHHNHSICLLSTYSHRFDKRGMEQDLVVLRTSIYTRLSLTATYLACRLGRLDGWLEGRSLGIKTGFDIGAHDPHAMPIEIPLAMPRQQMSWKCDQF
jgi:hypothetical protein